MQQTNAEGASAATTDHDHIEALHDMLAQAVAVTGHCVSLFRADGSLHYDNPKAAKYFGPDRSSFHDRFEDAEEAAAAWQRVKEGRVFKAHCQMVGPVTPRWFAVEVHSLVNSAGERFVALSGEDISSRIVTEETLRETTERLARSTAELDQLAYATSHDLREPLRNVVSHLTLLTRHLGHQVDPAARDFIRYAVDGAKRLDVLTHDLQQYVNIGKSHKLPQKVSLEAVVAAARERLDTTDATHEASFTIATPLPTVNGVTPYLERLFHNLFANAIKYRKPDTQARIEVFAERDRSAWVICVRDNGIGLEPRYTERVFQLFQRLHGNERYPGTGVGLAICHKVVEYHGGRIWVESAPGCGAAFFFTLPTD